MAHFAILSPPDAGHLYPLGNLGIELTRRGHQVTVIARAKAAAMVEQIGLPFRGLQTDHIPWPSAFLLWVAFSAVGQGWKVGFRNSFVKNAEEILQLVPPILKDLAVDGVITDQVLAGSGTAADRAGVPFVTVCTAPPWNEDVGQPPPFTSWFYEDSGLARLRNRCGYAGWRWFIRPTLGMINRYRKQWGLRPYRRMDDSYSSLAQISQLFAELDFPRTAIPPHFHYVGSLAADRPHTDEGFPWDRLDGRPLIYASLGTIADPMNRPVYPKIAAACEGLDAQLVLARGKWDGEDAGREGTHDMPGNPLVVDFAPQLALLERTAVLITHAGLNTTLEAISRGVPMVALARSADQPGNAARIEYAGAGLRGSFHHGTPEQWRRLIERVLTDDQFRSRARELQQAMASAGGVQRAAEIAEQAILSGRPLVHA